MSILDIHRGSAWVFERLPLFFKYMEILAKHSETIGVDFCIKKYCEVFNMEMFALKAFSKFFHMSAQSHAAVNNSRHLRLGNIIILFVLLSEA